MPRTGPAESNTGSILKASVATAEDAPEDEQHERPDAHREQALRHRRACHPEQVDGLDLTRRDLARAARRCGPGRYRARGTCPGRGHDGFERLFVGAACVRRVAAAGSREHVALEVLD